jgi:hypothetical protein
MGYGEYGGNGSVHWKIKHGRGREIKPGRNKLDSCLGIDAFPSRGGEFLVEVFDAAHARWSFTGGVLRVELPIAHGEEFTRQIKVSWPDPNIAGKSKYMAARRATPKTRRTTSRNARQRAGR